MKTSNSLNHPDLPKLSNKDLICALVKAQRDLYKILNEPINFENYPGQIMGLGDAFIEKQLLLEELLRRKQNGKI